ncbi:MAG: NAD(+) synthase [Clostridia bacterium]|nr:NAD(+) synthase [Clostridia bacterium]
MKHGFVRVSAATPTIRVADCRHNAAAVISAIRAAGAQGVQVLVLPELCVTGYTCGDLFLHDTLLDGAEDAALDIAAATRGSDMLVIFGMPLRVGQRLYNCAAAAQNGAILGIVPKSHLPNYGEFYEARHFSPAPPQNAVVSLGGEPVPLGTRLLFCCRELDALQVAIEICEDLWVPLPPSVAHAAAGATLIVNCSASDETAGKADYRRTLLTAHSARCACAYVYADAGEGESTTDMVFAGHDLIAENGLLLAETALFSGDAAVTEVDVSRLIYERRRTRMFPVPSDDGYTRIPFSLAPVENELTRPIDPTPFVPADGDARRARCSLILGLQTQGFKQRFAHAKSRAAVIGISGGLDSCLALLVAVRAMDALGRSRRDVVAVSMPCFGTTERTKNNAEVLCDLLGVTLRTIEIGDAVLGHFEDIGHDPSQHDVTFENAQARERTQVLMDIANQTGGLVVGTGDLSELALGWATYNGDHMSMYGVNAGIPKTLVRYIVRTVAEECGDRALRDVLLDIVATPVSPELLPADEHGDIAQKTEDLVGPYELHDFFLYCLLRWGFSPSKTLRLAQAAFGAQYERDFILHWLRTFCRRFFQQQYKRSCLPDGPKIGSVSLSPRGDWRMPSDASSALWLSEIETL